MQAVDKTFAVDSEISNPKSEMLKQFISLILPLVFGSLSGCAQEEVSGTLILDESGQTEKVTEVIPVDKVWAGHPVSFALLTSGERQYIAYYNASRNMVVGQRNLSDPAFTLFPLPVTTRDKNGGTSTVLGWDSHNYVTLAIDREGYLHLSGNMHVHPLTYFRSTRPNDITSLVQVMSMTGNNETLCTYPNFMKNSQGELIFHYRDGSSGNGNEIYNIYDTSSRTWKRLMDQPFTDGLTLMNAYMSAPTLKEDGWYHIWWVWRDEPDCATNHDLSYMKSRDLVNWYNPFGEPVKLPVSVLNKSVIVDPIPVKGGIINLAASLCLDEKGNPMFVYHKYDKDGNLQFYTARLSGKKWDIRQLTHWDYRWEFSGGGSIIFEVRVGEFKRRDDGNYEVGYSHIKYGSGTFLLNKSLEIIGVVKKPVLPSQLSKIEGTFPGLQVRTASDLGKSTAADVRYLLKWETLPANRDQARPEPWPEASQLRLYKLEK